MSDFTSKTYEYSGETTEWEDILINKGIRTKEEIFAEKGLNVHDFEKPKEDVEIEPIKTEEALNVMNLKQLDELEDEGELQDSHMLDIYRKKRLEELKQKVRIKVDQ